ncbi:MAG: Gfo/Idh/MocA family oxidoreductase [Gemmatimonadetes bacterium]|nr:Gfo/Idh/MocA family oxidoreductase [Gemmatimonadota bacterium]MBT6146630.1 Gfo/Idh/MocA family oxidoreductase [Gemmatimonadota bacterium]MBT7862850.1 Gfo/Idh/MocA family oxidoreductase [Gemmatimonadota bacterium]
MTLRVGIIGVGGIAGTHIPGWQASQDAELVAGSDISESALQAWGDLHGISKLETKAEDLIADPDIDIIDICTPNMYHAPLTIAALEAGKHVICEKPLAPTPADVQRMIEARDRSGKMLMTAQHFRFQGKSQAMKAELETGVLGDIYHARSWMLRRGGAPVRPGFILKEHSGGGPCIDIGVHILDLTLWFMGNPEPVAVSGVARNDLAKQEGAFSGWGRAPIPAEYDVEDFAAAFVRFENGATLVLEVSWLLHHQTEGEDMQMWLYGTRAGAHWPKAEFYESNPDTRQFYDRSIKLDHAGLEPHAQECVEFARAIAAGAPSPVPAEQSMQVMKILDGIYRSQEEAREVRLD